MGKLLLAIIVVFMVGLANAKTTAWGTDLMYIGFGAGLAWLARVFYDIIKSINLAVDLGTQALVKRFQNK